MPLTFLPSVESGLGQTDTGLSVKRLYLAPHFAGVLCADWTLPADERFLPLVQLTGWKPEGDVPFSIPVQYRRGSGRRSAALIPSGTWVLPYNDAHYQLYRRVQLTIHILCEQITEAPSDSRTLRMLARWAM